MRKGRPSWPRFTRHVLSLLGIGQDDPDDNDDLDFIDEDAARSLLAEIQELTGFRHRVRGIWGETQPSQGEFNEKAPFRRILALSESPLFGPSAPTIEDVSFDPNVGAF